MTEATTELECEIIEILAKANGSLSSTEVFLRLPAALRPRGKNGMCLALVAMAESGSIVRSGPSKKFTRYALPSDTAEAEAHFSFWPFGPVRRSFAT